MVDVMKVGELGGGNFVFAALSCLRHWARSLPTENTLVRLTKSDEIVQLGLCEPDTKPSSYICWNVSQTSGKEVSLTHAGFWNLITRLDATDFRDQAGCTSLPRQFYKMDDLRSNPSLSLTHRPATENKETSVSHNTFANALQQLIQLEHIR